MQELMIHFNAFCELFAQARQIKHQGKIKSPEGQNVVQKMVHHYNFFNKKMEDYVNKWRFELVEMGFYIKLNEPPPIPPKIDVSGVEESEEVSTSNDDSNLLFRKDFAHKDKKEVVVANYCEFSTPFSNLPKEHQEELIRKTRENLKFEEYARQHPEHAIQKIQRQNRNPRAWKLSDAERDW